MVACASRVGLRRYCTLLGEAGVTLTEDDAWQQYWLFAVYSWVAVTSTAGMAFGGTARLPGEDCVASGPLQAESAGRTYILVYRAMAKLYRP